MQKESPVHVHLLHNPKAGDQDHVKAELIKIVESRGFTCQYASIKDKGWKRFKSKTALVVVVGGDGTVREVIKKLLNRKLLDKPLAVSLIPSGTANNFAKTLGVSSELKDFERCLSSWKTIKVDIGAISNLRDTPFFIEGLGCGLIPKLIKEMKETDLSAADTADKELNTALEKLAEIAKTYRAKRAKIVVDGIVYEDDYLLVEVLNIKSVGPNLVLAPKADPTDNKFEVVLLRNADRETFTEYVHGLYNSVGGQRLKTPWEIVTATREITIQCDNRLMHVDDELVSISKGKKITIAIRPGIVDFIA
ncbi:diacylglycerol/lipid kinase family protein [Parapedobacter pyrenivorans]|uniref:diacylglycerol/lipid kinase family protein n=1 Tax=Parapedobacter pyrenivorans TaxID=1305674 RepID=UPI00333F00A9